MDKSVSVVQFYFRGRILEKLNLQIRKRNVRHETTVWQQQTTNIQHTRFHSISFVCPITTGVTHALQRKPHTIINTN